MNKLMDVCMNKEWMNECMKNELKKMAEWVNIPCCWPSVICPPV